MDECRIQIHKLSLPFQSSHIVRQLSSKPWTPHDKRYLVLPVAEQNGLAESDSHLLLQPQLAVLPPRTKALQYGFRNVERYKSTLEVRAASRNFYLSELNLTFLVCRNKTSANGWKERKWADSFLFVQQIWRQQNDEIFNHSTSTYFQQINCCMWKDFVFIVEKVWRKQTEYTQALSLSYSGDRS